METLVLSGIYDEAIISHLFLEMITSTAGTITATFSGIRVLVLRFPLNYKTLKEAILAEAEALQKQRQENSLLFRTHHFQALFKLACERFATSYQVLNFVETSHEKNPIPPSFGTCVKDFLGSMRNRLDILNYGIPLIASAIAFRCTPPGMHIFKPSIVFDLIYGSQMEQAFEGSASAGMAKNCVLLVEETFQRFRNSNLLSFSELHLENLNTVS
ncbi:hypothetical protein BGX38DRAFT_1170804 [Terfezia claveryi]|nr:hypothetical protein BGX38DRAFT_1170804 [Terfezia claveryi]